MAVGHKVCPRRQAPRDCQLGGVDPILDIVHWYMDGAQSGAGQCLYPGAVALEAFHADIVRHVAFAEVAALFDLPNVVGKEVSVLLDEIMHEQGLIVVHGANAKLGGRPPGRTRGLGRRVYFCGKTNQLKSILSVVVLWNFNR
jgi:hypothetical protein